MESRTRFLASHAVFCAAHSLHVPTAALRKPAPYLNSLLLRGHLPHWSSFLEASLSRQPGKDPASLPRQPLMEKPKKPSWHLSQAWPSTPGRQGHCPVLGWHWSPWEPSGRHLQLRQGKGPRSESSSGPFPVPPLPARAGDHASTDKTPSLCLHMSNSFPQAGPRKAQSHKMLPPQKKVWGHIYIWTIPFSWKVTMQLAY